MDDRTSFFEPENGMGVNTRARVVSTRSDRDAAARTEKFGASDRCVGGNLRLCVSAQLIFSASQEITPWSDGNLMKTPHSDLTGF